jgi:hypothetical protein
MCGKPECRPEERRQGADLGLYSITLNNDLGADHQTLAAYKAFRAEAAAKDFRHFLEVFDPNALRNPVPDLGRYVNDMIVRTLAGAVNKERPLFLKVVYHGPAAMEELVSYDSRLVVGILGGASGTTLDAFHQLWEAKKYGARVALYGRMINNAEHQSTFIEHLRAIADGHLQPAEAVRSYHAALARLGVRPYRKLEHDLQATLRVAAYGGQKPVSAVAANGTKAGQGSEGAEPDFAKMSQAEKVAWNLDRWKRILG